MISPRRQRQGSRVTEHSRACTEPCRTSVLIVMDNLGGVADSVEAGGTGTVVLIIFPLMTGLIVITHSFLEKVF